MNNTSNSSQHRLMSIKEACSYTSLSRSGLYDKFTKGEFPTPVSLGEKRIAFVRDEVERWVADRISERNAKVSR